MCLTNLAEIADAVRAAEKAAGQAATFEQMASDPQYAADEWSMSVTTVEARLIHANRIAAAEQALKDLGFRGPLAKAAPADAAETTRVLNAR